jgi:DNA polymerase-3 subunit epsilon
MHPPERPLAILDTETTGTNPATDRIIEIAIVRVTPSGTVSRFATLVNPDCPIPAEATAIHGITDEDVKGAPRFFAIAARALELLSGADLLGFCSAGFDIPLLWEEFFRTGVVWKIDGHILDAGSIFKKKQERTLAAALFFYCGQKHDDAHSALDDVEATLKVFEAQLFVYPDLREMTRAQLAEFCKFDDRIDLAGKLIRDKDGDPCFGIGEQKGKKIWEDLGFARWMLGKDFPEETKMHLRRILAESGGKKPANPR